MENDNIQKIKDEMLSAVILDNSLNREKKPALNKLNNLEKFTSILVNKKIQTPLLDENILDVVRKWLEPLPDKSLPNIKIRIGLLEVLKNINVSKAHLLESNVGKIVHFYMINPEEDKCVRNLAKEVVNKWISKISNEGEEE